MIKLAHHDDGKQKCQSHEITVLENSTFYNNDFNVFSHDFFDICGYGSNKEEALKDFKRKFEYILNEWVAFGKLLFETSVIEDSMIEVDCFGKEVPNNV